MPKQDKQKEINENTFLETKKQHKDWYDPSQMGKQGNRPVGRPKENKKEKGTRKHSLRKEK